MISWQFVARPPSAGYNRWYVKAYMPGAQSVGYADSRFLCVAILKAMRDAERSC